MRDSSTAPPPAPAGHPPTGEVSPDAARADRLRGFGPAWALSFLLVLFASLFSIGLGALVVLAWARASRTPWRDLGFVRPRSWTLTVLGGVLLGAAFKLAMKSLVMPLLGAPPMNQAYQHLAGNPGAVPGFVFAILFGAAFGEEVVFRGYLFERSARGFGTSPLARVLTVVVTAALFSAAHIANQGAPGAQQAFVTGAVFGGLFAATRQLPLIMIAHAAFDLVAYALIYFRLETQVAHAFFR